jgi:hypothetical protein
MSVSSSLCGVVLHGPAAYLQPFARYAACIRNVEFIILSLQNATM